MALIAVAQPSYIKLLTLIGFYIALGQAVNIFTGLTGYLNFGFAALLAMGAYGLGVTIAYYPGLGPAVVPLGIMLGMAMSAAVAAAIGAVALRLRGAYFAIATIGVNQAIRYFIEGTGIWGGGSGLIFGVEAFKALGRDTAIALANIGSALLIISAGLAAALVTYFIAVSKVGYALAAVRQDEDAAKAMGVNPTSYKLLAFVVSAAISGFLGAVYYPMSQLHVFPQDVFDIGIILGGLAVVFVGGVGTATGPVVGGLIYAGLSYLIGLYLPGYQSLAAAFLILLFQVFLPRGIVGELIYRRPELYRYIV
ncbi:MAG: branched-chain amino acid ABC transporter permease [Thermoproteus sp.]|nr:branched-chain amino acid ABC transporter permease [Thermoproteus sp.]